LREARRTITCILVLLVFGLLPLIGPGQGTIVARSEPAASVLSSTPSQVQFTGVTPQTVKASTDYATDVRGRGWNFEDEFNYAKELTSLGYENGGGIVDGMFVGTSNSNIAENKIWPQDMTDPITIPIDNEGGYAPIDTSRYRYITFRMYSSRDVLGVVYWHRTKSFARADLGESTFIPFQRGWHTYTLDPVTQRGGGDLAWRAGPIEAIAIKTAFAAGVTTKLDWVRISTTPPAEAPEVTIRWTPASTTFDLYYDTDPRGMNATLIQKNVLGTTGIYRWRTPNLAPATYYLFSHLPGRTMGALPSQTPLSFKVNAPPHGTILAPSFTSGPDYATEMLGNPWDMSDRADIAMMHNLTNTSFQNGIFRATNSITFPSVQDDPGITLAMGPPIDPQRYYYATYRMRLLGPQDVFLGSVSRFHWSVTPDFPGSYTTLWSKIVYEGWRTVTVDLRSAPIESVSRGGPWSNGQSKVIFRFDPHEFPVARTFEIDDIKLTRNDQASTSFAIRYTAGDRDNDTLTRTFYFTPDRTGAGGTVIRCEGGAPPTSSRYRVYLPLVRRGGMAADGSACVWNVRSVAPGNYFVKMVLDDGINSTVVLSQTPLEIRR
jgi:hypothetical protein